MVPVISSASVVEQLERGDFFSESITKRSLFASVHDAVLYCLNHRGATSFPRYEPSVVSIHNLCSGESWHSDVRVNIVSCSYAVSSYQHWTIQPKSEDIEILKTLNHIILTKWLIDFRTHTTARNFKDCHQRGNSILRMKNTISTSIG